MQPTTEAVFALPAETPRTTATFEAVASACKTHHNSNGCLVLKALFGTELSDRYAYNACTAHIYNKSMRTQFMALTRQDVDHPKNTFRLLQHVEYQFDKGNLMILPVRHDWLSDTFLYQMHVHESVKDEVISIVRRPQNRKEELQKTGPVCVPVFYAGLPPWYSTITFGYLHEKCFEASRVFMRSLFEKAVMARNEAGHEVSVV
eukprot:470753-Amphidinium_carterae.1